MGGPTPPLEVPGRVGNNKRAKGGAKCSESREEPGFWGPGPRSARTGRDPSEAVSPPARHAGPLATPPSIVQELFGCAPHRLVPAFGAGMAWASCQAPRLSSGLGPRLAAGAPLAFQAGLGWHPARNWSRMPDAQLLPSECSGHMHLQSPKIWQRSGRIWGRHGSNSAAFGPSVPKFGTKSANSANGARHRPNAGRSRPVWVRIRPTSRFRSGAARFGPRSANIDQHLSRLGQEWFGIGHQRWFGIGQPDSGLVGHRPTASKIGSASTKLGPESTTFGPLSATLGPTLANVRPSLARMQQLCLRVRLGIRQMRSLRHHRTRAVLSNYEARGFGQGAR